MSTEIAAMAHAPTMPRRPGFFKNLLYWLLDWDDPATLEEGRRRLRNAPREWPLLSPEALEYLRTYNGPEIHGPPLTKRERRDLEERMAKQATRLGRPAPSASARSEDEPSTRLRVRPAETSRA